MRSNSAWGADRQTDQREDLASLLRSPVFVTAAIVVVAGAFIANALGTRGWVEVAPIPVLQERQIEYLEDEGIFVFWNSGAPYGIDEETPAGGRVLFCSASGSFLASDGRSYDRRGRPLDGRGRGLLVLPARMDGHLVFVDADRSHGSSARADVERPAPAPGCDAPAADDRGLARR